MTEKYIFNKITNLLAATLLAEPDFSLVSTSVDDEKPQTASTPAVRVIDSRLAKLTQKISGAEEAEQEVTPAVPD